MSRSYGAVDSTSAARAEPPGDDATHAQRAVPKAALVVVGGLAMLAGIGAAMRRDPRERRAASMTAARASSAAAHGGDAPYARTHALSGEAFFDAFTFFNSSDPSHGTVECVSDDASLSRRAPRRARAPLTARSARSFSLSDRYVDRPTALEYGLISTNATTGEVRRHQVWYDDPNTLAAKYDVVAAKHGNGVAMWTANNGDDAMWDALLKALRV